MSTATSYKLRSKYGGMDASLMKRMKELEDENRRTSKKCALKKSSRLKLPESPLKKYPIQQDWLSVNAISTT